MLSALNGNKDGMGILVFERTLLLSMSLKVWAFKLELIRLYKELLASWSATTLEVLGFDFNNAIL